MTQSSSERTFFEFEATALGGLPLLRVRCYISQKEEYVFQIGQAGEETVLVTTVIPPEEVDEGETIASLLQALFDALPDEAYRTGYSILRLREILDLKKGELNA